MIANRSCYWLQSFCFIIFSFDFYTLVSMLINKTSNVHFTILKIINPMFFKSTWSNHNWHFYFLSLLLNLKDLMNFFRRERTLCCLFFLPIELQNFYVTSATKQTNFNRANLLYILLEFVLFQNKTFRTILLNLYLKINNKVTTQRKWLFVAIFKEYI